MRIIKTLVLDEEIKISLSAETNRVKVRLLVNDTVFFTKCVLNSKVICLKQTLFIFKNLAYKNAASMLNFFSEVGKKVFHHNYLSFGKVFMIGLGFKNFVLGEKLYLLVGDCNYIIFSIPRSIKIYCKKNQIYMLSNSSIDLFDFMSEIKKIKKPNFYKGKGVLQFKNFKFTKLKVGKKQRFM